jgi:chemotaxis protein CheY-P-specific phosphatase CheC
MPETIFPTVLECLAESLETMAFASVTPPTGEPAVCPPRAMRVAVQYSGARSGTLELIASEALGLHLASNILGCEPDHPDALARADDALAELMNVTCGLYLTRRLATLASRVEMKVPVLERLSHEQWIGFAGDPDAMMIEADGHPVGIRLKEVA